MNTHKKTAKKPVRFLVLVPHRDSRNIIEEYRRRLFSVGFAGAYSFPAAAPLALLSRPLNKDELKTIAQKIRDETLYNEGKISTGENSLIGCAQPGPFEKTAFYGPALNLPFPNILSAFANDKVLYAFPKAVLCAALSGPADEQTLEHIAAPQLEPFGFRAAMVSNLAIRPLESGQASASAGANAPYSFEWRLGPGCWLPGYKKK